MKHLLTFAIPLFSRLLHFGTHHPLHFRRGSRSLAHDYLPNLIRDLHRDINRPELPVVVAVIGWNGPHTEAVRNTQLAIAESVDRTATVDTRPFLTPAPDSQGERADMYRQHAGTFLDIGGAIGREMIRLEALSTKY